MGDWAGGLLFVVLTEGNGNGYYGRDIERVVVRARDERPSRLDNNDTVDSAHPGGLYEYGAWVLGGI